jgi:hypothetical protein
MQQQATSTEERIAQLKQNYTRLALQCKAAGVRVNAATIAEYAAELEKLETQLA